MECCVSGRSGVVVNSNGKIVGVLLAQRDLLDWALANKETINVCLAAVGDNHRDSDAFKLLFDALISRGAPIFAAVAPDEKQRLADRLKDFGFSALPSDDKSTLYKWEPPAATPAAA
jgi:hypothetical protein